MNPEKMLWRVAVMHAMKCPEMPKKNRITGSCKWLTPNPNEDF